MRTHSVRACPDIAHQSATWHTRESVLDTGCITQQPPAFMEQAKRPDSESGGLVTDNALRRYALCFAFLTYVLMIRDCGFALMTVGRAALLLTHVYRPLTGIMENECNSDQRRSIAGGGATGQVLKPSAKGLSKGSVVKLSKKNFFLKIFFLLSFKLSKKIFFYSVSGVSTQLRN